MPHFDRYDVCEAYLALEMDWNQGGVIPERPHTQRWRESIGTQLARIGYRPGALFKGYASLPENAREIYWAAVEAWGLGDGGYKPCACRDCQETAIGHGKPLCHACSDAGCTPCLCDGGARCTHSECAAPGAYGADDEDGAP